MEWYIGVLKKYTVFTGRARRKEFWMFMLFNYIVYFVLYILAYILAHLTWLQDILYIPYIYYLAVLFPALGVSIRRLHDTNRSGWFLLLYFIPSIIISKAELFSLTYTLTSSVALIIFIIFTVQEGTPGDNKYGPDPKAQESI